MTAQRDLFVDEGRESIDAMNNGLLALEDTPGDDEAMDAVFRHAHTLKGNAAALGMEAISDLAHVLEDLLDQVRKGTVEIDPSLMDELFAAVDQLEVMLQEIDQHGESKSDPGDLIDRLEAVQDGTDATGDDAASGTEPAVSPTDDATRARIEVTGGMPGVDATFVLTTIEETFDDLQVAPDRNHVEAGEFDGSFEVAVPGAPENLADLLGGSPHVDGFEVLNGSGEQSPPETDSDSPDEPDEQLSSVRVDIDRLVELNELVEQLVTSRIRINRELDQAGVESDAIRDLEKVSQRLRDVAMEMRLVPFDTISRGFPRVVRDTARELDKEIDFSMTGTDVEVDRRLLTRLKDPMIHVLRNAVDHGIEPPDERQAAGKPAAGTVEIDVRRERDEVVVEVSDDGGGIEVERVRDRALAEGIHTAEELDAMADEEIYDLLFHPGFSTAGEVTDVSGRGVGMDVVRETVTDLDGSVTLESERGRGTTVRFRLPVTMAVADVMLIRSEGQLLGVPISDIEEVSTGDVVKRAHGQPVVEREEGYSPVLDLASEYQASALADGGRDQTDVTEKKLVVIREDQRDIALACDEVMGQEEVVVKPLAGPLSGTPGVSGTAVLGDQQLVPIIDVVSI